MTKTEEQINSTLNDPKFITSREFFIDIKTKRRALQVELAKIIGDKLYAFSSENGVNVDGFQVYLEPLFIDGSPDPAHVHVSTHIDIKI